MAGWYQKIARDISAIPEAIKHYEAEAFSTLPLILHSVLAESTSAS
jgi:hypothetical protein